MADDEAEIRKFIAERATDDLGVEVDSFHEISDLAAEMLCTSPVLLNEEEMRLGTNARGMLHEGLQHDDW